MWVVTKESELMHYGVPGMKWGVRKDQSYRQDLGGGVTAIWPSKRAFEKAEKKRLSTAKKSLTKDDKNQLKKDTKEYQKLRDDFGKSLMKSVEKKTTEGDTNQNLLKMKKVYDYLDDKAAKKGRTYAELMINQANKQRKAENVAVGTAFVVTAAAILAGTTYIESKFSS